MSNNQDWAKEILPIVQAMAEGKQIQRCNGAIGQWYDNDDGLLNPHWTYRIKPETIMVNGVEVPAPFTGTPMGGWCYYVPYPSSKVGYLKSTWTNDERDRFRFRNGLVYAKKEDAALRAEAMRKYLPPFQVTGLQGQCLTTAKPA